MEKVKEHETANQENVEPDQDQSLINLRNCLAEGLKHVKNEYKPDPDDNSKAELTHNEIGGTVSGVYTKEKISQNEVIATFKGPTFQADKISELPTTYLQDHVVQVGERDYLSNESGIAHLLNHSCDPNCGIIDGIKIVAMREIEPGESLTWDYESTEDSDWEMTKCECGSDNCRGKIRAFRYMPVEQRQKLKGFISPWILEKYKNQVDFENLTSENITAQHIEELKDIILFVFYNDWPEYAYCPECDPKIPHGKKFSARDIFNTPEDKYIPLTNLLKTDDLPNCDDCGTQTELFMDPKTTVETLKKKLSERAWLSLMRNAEGDVIGANYAYKRKIREIFENEWGQVYSYADEAKRPKDKRSFKNFQQRISDAIRANEPNSKLDENELLPEDTEVICANLIVVHPEYRGKGHFFNLATQTFMIMDPQDWMDSYGLGESVKKTKAHSLFLRGGALEIPGILQPDSVDLNEEDYVIVLYRIKKFFEAFFRPH